MLIGFVIVLKVNKDTFDYFAIDHTSGGYPYWTRLVKNAKIFETKEDAEKELTSDAFTKNSIMTDGTMLPPSMVQSGANINYRKKSGTAEIAISKLEVVLGNCIEFFGEIKKPTGITYDKIYLI